LFCGAKVQHFFKLTILFSKKIQLFFIFADCQWVTVMSSQ